MVKRKSLVICVRLREGKDDDLIKWWNNQKRDKSYKVRNCIRASFEMDSTPNQHIETHDSPLIPTFEKKEIVAEKVEVKDLMSQFNE